MVVGPLGADSKYVRASLGMNPMENVQLCQQVKGPKHCRSPDQLPHRRHLVADLLRCKGVLAQSYSLDQRSSGGGHAPSPGGQLLENEMAAALNWYFREIKFQIRLLGGPEQTGDAP